MTIVDLNRRQMAFVRPVMRAQQFQSLTSLRGLAAVAVMLFHCTSEAFGGASGTGLALIPRRGYLAVDFFFLLSGFILAHVYGNTFMERIDVGKYVRFLWARLARIYPVHLFVLLLYVKFYGAAPDYSGQALLANLFLLQAPWLGYDSWNAVSWSISAEWHAYLLFPLFCLVLARLRSGLAMIIAAACLTALALDGSSAAYVRHGVGVLAHSLPEFLLGILVYRLYASGWGKHWWRADAMLAALGLAILGLAATWPTDPAIIALMPALLLAAASNGGYLSKLLATRPLLFLGKISYSIYMVHLLCLAAVVGVAKGIVGIADLGLPERIGVLTLSMALSLALATLVSRCIEYPARVALRRVVDPQQTGLQTA